MKPLPLKEAEALKDKLVKVYSWYDAKLEKAQWLYWVRRLYDKGFVICPEPKDKNGGSLE